MTQKGFDILIQSLAIAKRECDVKVIFVGEGPAKDYLIDIMSRLDLDDSIDFVGHQQNPIKYMCKADLFVLPSGMRDLH